MANIPCPIHVKCPPDFIGQFSTLEFDSPLANFSSEGPDLNLCFEIFYISLTPPLDTCFSNNKGTGVGSQIDCQQALLDAYNNANADAISGWNKPGCLGDPPPGTPPDQPPGLPPGLPCASLSLCPPVRISPSNPQPLFFNQQQTCTVTCPDGLPFTWTVAAGTLSDLTLAYANAKAFSIACQQANAHFLCLSSLNPNGCVGTKYSSTITVETGVLAATPLSFNIIGGNLPPGLVTQQSSDSLSFIISGIPTTAGQYNFMIQVMDAHGNFMQKSYMLGILGITNIASVPPAMEMRAYNFQLNAAGGTAPYTFSLVSGNLPGITISSSGLMSGTPNYVTAGSYPFTVTVTDASGHSCTQNGTLVITLAPGPDWTKLVWSPYQLNLGVPSIPPNFVSGSGISNTANGIVDYNNGLGPPFPSITPVGASGVTYTGPQVTSRIILTVTFSGGAGNSMSCRVLYNGVQINNGGYAQSFGSGVFTFDFIVAASVGAHLSIDDGSPGNSWAILNQVGNTGSLSFTWAIVNV